MAPMRPRFIPAGPLDEGRTVPEATRRAFLAGAMGVLAALPGCAAKPPPPAPAPTPDTPPPLVIPELLGLLPVADLRWMVHTKPREIAAVPWLIPAIARVAPEDNLTRFTQKLGFD